MLSVCAGGVCDGEGGNYCGFGADVDESCVIKGFDGDI